MGLRLQLPKADRALQAGMDQHTGAFTCCARVHKREAEFSVSAKDIRLLTPCLCEQGQIKRSCLIKTSLTQFDRGMVTSTSCIKTLPTAGLGLDDLRADGPWSTLLHKVFIQEKAITCHAVAIWDTLQLQAILGSIPWQQPQMLVFQAGWATSLAMALLTCPQDSAT